MIQSRQLVGRPVIQYSRKGKRLRQAENRKKNAIVVTIGGCQRTATPLPPILVYLRSFLDFICEALVSRKENREPEQEEIWSPSRTFCSVTEPTLTNIFFLFCFVLPCYPQCGVVALLRRRQLRDSLYLYQTLRARVC